MRRKFLLLLSCMLFSSSFVFAATWQENLESHFDIVETFDELQDWHGVNGFRGVDYNKSHMPKKLDGAPSMWDLYDDWSYGDPVGDWIKNHGSANVWRGTGKSLVVDMDSHDNDGVPRGAQRFGLYFKNGDGYATSGTKDDGYNDIYIFYMVKFPHNHFPRDGNGTPVYYGYYKFSVLASGFTSAGKHAAYTDGRANVYGGSYILQLVRTGSSFSNEYIINYGMRVFDWNDWDNQILYETYPATLAGNQGSSMKPYIDSDGWFGLEVHQTMGSPGGHDAITEEWLYAPDGTVTKTMYKTDGYTTQVGHAYKYNKFFFGGNQAFSNEAGLNLTYFVDDFIINDSRIGPTYFQMLRGESVKELDVTNVTPSPGVWSKEE